MAMQADRCQSWRQWAAAAFVAIASTLGSQTPGQDFRLQSKVYAGAGKEPIGENVTMFRGGLVCDFVENPPEVVVYNPEGATFVLLDPQRKVRADVSVEQIDELTSSLREKLAERNMLSRDEFAAFLSAPTFRFSPDNDSVACVSPWMHYHVRAAAASGDVIARQYAAFSTHTTRLNALRRPALLARVAVNDWLNERKLIPQEVRLTLFTKSATGQMTPQSEFRTEHTLTSGLSPADLARLAQVIQWQGECQRVSLEKYWGVGE